MLKPEELSITIYTVGNGALREHSIDAARITHIPTGVTVSCFSFPTYEQNRDRALEMLERQVNRIHNKQLDK